MLVKKFSDVSVEIEISWPIGATTYSYLKRIVYDKLLKPRQSFRITLYIFYLYFNGINIFA
jgi:hypothetical protein